MVRTFIQMMVLLLTLMSAFFLISAIMNMSIKDMTELSKATSGYNLVVVKNLAQQKSSTLVGFVLLLMSYLFALIGLMLPMRCSDFKVNKKGLIIAFVMVAIMFFVANEVFKTLAQKWYEQTELMLRAEKE